MKTKAHILIVEDEALLYKRMKTVLLREHFSVAEYTPSVAEALNAIQHQTPDLVLLDINLQGESTGLDLGRMLYKKYDIPFIYVTDFSDDYTFYKGLETHHENFIVKTKPHLNPTEIIRAIYTALQKKQNKLPVTQQGIIGLVDYISDLKIKSDDKITRTPILFEEIAFFTTDQLPEGNKVRKNYVWLQRTDGALFFIKSSLKELLNGLPEYFVQINECYIVNLSHNVLQGRIHKTRLSIMNNNLSISRKFLNQVNQRIAILYK